MADKNTQIPLVQSKYRVTDEVIDPQKIISFIGSHKYIIITSLFVALVIAFLYNTYTMPVYKVTATILIEEDKKTVTTGNDQLLQGFGLMPGMKNLDNQIMVLTSHNLVLKTLNELSFNTEYYYKGLTKKKSLYPVKPFDIIPLSGSKLPEDVEFTFKYLGSSKFRLTGKSGDTFRLQKEAGFGESIDFPGGTFKIEQNEKAWPLKNGKKRIFFIFHSQRKLVASYTERLKIDPLTKKGTIVKISLQGTNKLEDLEFLDRLTKVFVNISLDKKNSEAIRTIQFIDDQLTGISDSLLITESKLQQFRTRNRVTNLSSQGQVIIDQAMRLENEKSKLGMEAKYYNYLTEYLEKDAVGEVPIAPATMGIIDPGLARLVADLAAQQGQLYSKVMGEKNPMQNQLTQKVNNIKTALKETLKGMKGANDLAINDNQEQINSINDKATALPRTERELLGIERKYKLNDELYTFLLEKRATAQMQKASNTADNEIIDYAEYGNDPVSPKKSLIYLFALIAGIGIPLLWDYFVKLFSMRIKEVSEIKDITDVPISGHIPHCLLKKTTFLMDEPDSQRSEAYRILRSRMKYFIKEDSKPVILITSSMPDEGKSTVSLNLASAFSLLGKKTVFVGFDLRRPVAFTEFGIDNTHGVSTWLIGKDPLDKIIYKTKFSNLHIIPSGPVPPNPAELTTLDKSAELIKLLKEKYDYIVIDSSPVGVVSDTYHLISMADICIVVVRQNHTLKSLLSETLNDLKNSNTKSLSLVVNDIMPNGRSYGYGGKFKYLYNK